MNWRRIICQLSVSSYSPKPWTMLLFGASYLVYPMLHFVHCRPPRRPAAAVPPDRGQLRDHSDHGQAVPPGRNEDLLGRLPVCLHHAGERTKEEKETGEEEKAAFILKRATRHLWVNFVKELSRYQYFPMNQIVWWPAKRDLRPNLMSKQLTSSCWEAFKSGELKKWEETLISWGVRPLGFWGCDSNYCSKRCHDAIYNL